jgi:hypothetical protein
VVKTVLTTFLGILKIILLIILVLLLIVITLISLVLFVPIKYKVVGNKYEDFNINGKFSWLCGILRGKYIKDGDNLEFNIKVFFKTLSSDQKEKKSRKKTKSKSKDTANTSNNDENIEQSDSYVNEDASSALQVVEVKKDIREQSNINKSMSKEKIKRTHKKKKSKKRKINILKGKSNFIEKVKDIINKENKVVIKYIIDQLKAFLKKIMPKYIKVKVKFGTGDPATTGYVLGILSISYALAGNKIAIIPNFEDKEFSGDFNIKGRLFLVIVLYYLLKLIINKRVRRLIANFN